MKLNENERLDDIQLKKLKIIQNKEGFCFGIDSVILSEFANKIKHTDNVLDLGSGTGILELLIYGKYEPKKIIGIEVQKDVAEMSRRSIKINNLENKMEIINENIKNIFENKLIKTSSFDVVITNPPYKEINTGVINNNEKKLISRHEVTASLEDFIKTGYKALKNNGIFYMVHRPDRLVDILYLLRKNKMEPKEIRFVSPNIDGEINLVLIKAIKNGNKFLKINKTLYIYEKNGEYTEEIKKIYNN